MDPRHERLLEILKRESYVPGRVKLASGRESDFYIDVRKSAFLPEAASLIGEVLYDRVEPHALNAVGGMAVGAIPLVDAVLHASMRRENPVQGFFVRKAAKGHGMQKRIEGRFAKGYRVAILEDVVTTGDSSLGAAESVEAEGGTVALVLALVDRLEGGREAITARGYPFEAVFTRRDFV
ncbi:MAG: orotate phosphoribosyltransferase [Deltaproteobacteria bacterium]|nr:orotate phosphoribosyltransferase [Deltaproteobacteria bacterium]